MKTSKKSIIILVIVLILAVALLVYGQMYVPASSTLTASSTSTTSPIGTSFWKTFSSPQPPFSIKYPADFVFSTSTIPTVDGPYLLALQFPKDIYFSTVLKDEAYVIVTASSTCPVVEPGGLTGDNTPQTVNFLDGLSFVRNRVDDVAAGNRYETLVYDTIKNGTCYRVTFFDHGANGAGLYLSDPVAIQAADATHGAEISKIEAIVNAMVGTFSTAVSK